MIKLDSYNIQIDEADIQNVINKGVPIGMDAAGSPAITFEGWALVRSIRRTFLLQSDWTQYADAPLSENEKALWQAYRQALRDIPQVYANYQDVIFPTPPEAVNG